MKFLLDAHLPRRLAYRVRETLLVANLSAIAEAFATSSFLEITRTALIVHC